MPDNLPDLIKVTNLPTKASNGGCPFFGGRLTQFSKYSDQMAALFNSPQGGRNMDPITVFTLGECGSLKKIDAFPGERFILSDYNGPDNNPTLFDFGWDGHLLFALHGNKINDFGDLSIYKMNTHLASIVNLIGNLCCYQDLQFSPDGQYLLFVFQDAQYMEQREIYYIPFAKIGTGETFIPFSVPYFFRDTNSKVELALRPAVENLP